MTIRDRDHLGQLLSPNKVIIDLDIDVPILQITHYSQNAEYISLKALCKITALLGDINKANYCIHIDIPLYRRMVIKGICS